MKRVWSVLLKVAQRIGRVQAWLIFTLFYFIIVAPVALLFKLCADPLHLRRTSRSIWTARSQPDDRVAWGKAQS